MRLCVYNNTDVQVHEISVHIFASSDGSGVCTSMQSY